MDFRFQRGKIKDEQWGMALRLESASEFGLSPRPYTFFDTCSYIYPASSLFRPRRFASRDAAGFFYCRDSLGTLNAP